MARISRFTAVAFWLALSVAHGPVLAGTPQEGQVVSAKTWLENRTAIEEYIRTAAVLKEEEIAIGVTRPRRLQLEPGGPVEHIAFKAIQPGIHGGYWESYKSEIAAYELDKLLGLDMVPPTVEKRVKGVLGAAVMWCSPTKSFKEMGGVPKTSEMPGAQVAPWVRQVVRAKMFDNLIGNRDPNLGNWLVDPAWNLIVIDKTRAFTSDRNLVHTDVSNFDMTLWEKMQALTEDSLAEAIGQWVGRREIRAILERRARMQQVFDKLVAQRGNAAFFR